DDSVLQASEAGKIKIPSVARAFSRGVLLRALDGQGDPRSLASLGIHNPKTNDGIGVAGFGIFLPVDGGMSRQIVGDGIRGHGRLVHLEISDLLAVGRPVVVAAYV